MNDVFDIPSHTGNLPRKRPHISIYQRWMVLTSLRVWRSHFKAYHYDNGERNIDFESHISPINSYYMKIQDTVSQSLHQSAA